MIRTKIIWILFFMPMLVWGCAGNHPEIEPARPTLIPVSKPDTAAKKPGKNETLHQKRQIIVDQALSLLGAPYSWGGRSRQTGFDCSGLVVFTHGKAGLALPRTAKDQFQTGQIVPKNHLLPGDLVFFSNPDASKSFHVGIYIGDGLFIHAPGRNRLVTYAQLENPYFKKHYIGSKTFLTPPEKPFQKQHS